MPSTQAPKDGDFAALLEGAGSLRPTSPQPAAPVPQQTVEDAIAHGEEPTDELLQEMRALDEAPPLSDEELERQALAHPGGDGNTDTPE
ncbi:MAG: hypothetical protein IPK34_06360 [Ramlibacter sp.]|nr:hypothetical protein [Ramlibacter sp.]